MKHYFLILSVLILMCSCKSDKSNSEVQIIDVVELSPAEKIANAYGIENWKNVTSIQYTFNVTKDSSHFKRAWQWYPKTNDVVLISNSDTIRYNRTKIDSTVINADKAFINDKYWLLAPFNLIWDEGTTISNPVIENAPISKKALNKITLTYSNIGGYTPGDAYDFYYNDSYLIEEWVFRKANAPSASMITTWENHTLFNGITLALDHNKVEDDWKLFFTNVSIN